MKQRINHRPTAIVFGAILWTASVATVADYQSIQPQLAAEK